jgi:DNA primase catalytic core
MAGDRDNEQPDLVAEAQFWRDWNTSVYEQTHSPEEAAAIAARVSPDPDRIAAALARAQASTALTSQPRAARHGELVQIHADAGRFYQSCLPGSWVPEYLASRGLEAVLLPSSPWKVGYAPRSWTALSSHLRELGYSDEAMLKSGLAVPGKNGKPRDMFHDRLMIPVRRPGDRVVIAFVGRRSPAAGDEHGPKYLNSPNTELYVKSHVLPGLAEGQRFLDQGAQPVFVEGVTDAWAVSIAAPGRYVGLPLCGTALSGEQVAALARAVDLPERGVRVAFDPDSAGSKAAIRAYASLSAADSADLTAVILSGGRDPAERLQREGPAALRDALASSTCPLAEIVVDARMSHWAHGGELASAEQQLGALRAACAAIVTMPLWDAATQARRVARLFSTTYSWSVESINRELMAAFDSRHYQGLIQPFEQDSEGLPPATASVIARSAAPHQGTARPASSAPRAQSTRWPSGRDRSREGGGRGLSREAHVADVWNLNYSAFLAAP